MAESLHNASLELTLDDVNITLRRVDDRYQLAWNDGVANEFTEWYPSLQYALCRLAALLDCRDSDWERFFTTDPEHFALDCRYFLDGQSQT